MAAVVKLDENKYMTTVSTRKFASFTEHIFNAKTVLYFMLGLYTRMLCLRYDCVYITRRVMV